MIKTFRTEIKPTAEQTLKINQTIGTVRYLYNAYLAYRIKEYETNKRTVSPSEFYSYINNTLIPNNPDLIWILETHNKARKQALRNVDNSFQRFFKGLSGFPRFKKKKNQDTSWYFVKNDKKTVILTERHRLKIPGLGFVRIKEKGYIPTTKELDKVSGVVKSGTIKRQADRYFVTVTVFYPDSNKPCNINTNDGLGIDMGIKSTAVLSDDTAYPNINKTDRIRKINKQIKRTQRSLSRKTESNKKNKIKKGEPTKNINKTILRLQKLHLKKSCILDDYYNKIVNEIVKTKPSYITLENLAIKNIMKNRHLARAIQEQALYSLKLKIISRCRAHDIEIRQVDRFFASSKTCSVCHSVKKDLTLKDRIYNCPHCGLSMDRDLNAAINLKNAAEYIIL